MKNADAPEFNGFSLSYQDYNMLNFTMYAEELRQS